MACVRKAGGSGWRTKGLLILVRLGSGCDHGSEGLTYVEDRITGVQEIKLPKAKVWEYHLCTLVTKN